MEADRQQWRPPGLVVPSGKGDGSPPRESKNSASERICGELGEHDARVCLNIRRLVSIIGVERADELVRQSEAIEAGGGMLVPDGSRRRTFGGVFFKLVRDTVPEEERYKAWPWQRPRTVEERREWKRLDRKARRARGQGKSKSRSISSEACRRLVAKAQEMGLGVATTMKITVIGRPGPVVQQGQAMLTVLQGAKIPTLPRGLPTPQNMPSCAVFISAKQWRKVAGVLKDEQDALIIQGVPTLDPGFNGITVLATSVTTKLLEKAKREERLSA